MHHDAAIAGLGRAKHPPALCFADDGLAVREACGEHPHAFALEHLPTFALERRRRRPSVEKAKRLLGFDAQIELTDAIAATVRWLREREVLTS